MSSETSTSIHPSSILIDQELYEAFQSLINARKQLSETRAKIQSECTHDVIIECPYKENRYTNHTPPKRACVRCLLVEEGWGCGYETLKTNSPHMVSINRFKEFVSCLCHVH